ncbi:MAG: histidine phosphatase family protein [Gammaproteobacteria bacterium]|nr:histidine phosphatase family protein [Gammaproteobacteria bacterium]
MATAVTRRITLLRHARAVPGDATTPDEQRPLDERGEREAPLIGRRLRNAGARPSLILVSPAVRALQTARLVAQELGYPQEFLQRETDLYLASPAAILAVLARQDDSFHDILVCGHNPGLTDLANGLTDAGIVDLPTCGFVVIEATLRQWCDLGAGSRLVLADSPEQPAR